MADLQKQIYEPGLVFKWIRAAASNPGVPRMEDKTIRVAVKSDYRDSAPTQGSSNGQTGDVAIEHDCRRGRLRFHGLPQGVEQLAPALNHQRFSLLDKCRQRAGRPGWGLVWGSGTAQ